jgi:hypothetical protein
MELEIETAVEDRVQQSELPDRETPVSESEVEKPVAPSAISDPAEPKVMPEARLVSHLANVELPTDFDARAQSEREEISETIGNLPDTYSAALAALHEANAIIPKDKFEAKVKAAKLERLRGHVHALSQAPAAPTVNSATHFKRTPPADALARINELYPKPAKAKKAAN